MGVKQDLVSSSGREHMLGLIGQVSKDAHNKKTRTSRRS